MAAATKFCPRCGNEKPFAAFSYCRRSADKLQRWCRACQRAYRVENREYIAERDRTGHRAGRYRRYFAANRDKALAGSRAYHWKNRDEVLRKMRLRDARRKARGR